ncbi:MAG: patatin-like phospholipase family protein, partial [Psychromonas sp.]|nr:patatin-like phospholipase family protein [Psychromonas sp.]
MNNNKIAISLSGGGTRAIAYHSGFLNYLAEIEQLEEIKKISSVSGGSLLVGLIFKEGNYQWPTSKQYRHSTYKQIKKQLTTKNLQWQLFFTLCNPFNWQYWLSRANVLSMVLTRCWGIRDNLSSLPKTPQWSINATTLENGCRFRFKDGSCGDYSLGYAKSTHFSLANAMAMSAALPGGIGPLVIKSNHFNWKKKTQWYGDKGSEVEVKLPFKKLHLSDGGVYDNLGIEPFFDSGKTKSKVKGHNLY